MKEALKIRIEELKKNTLPVIEYYQDTDLFIRIDGNKSPELIFDEIKSKIDMKFMKQEKN